MKKLFLLSAAAVLLLASCNNKKEGGGMSDRAQKNLDALHKVNKAFETGDVSAIDSVVAENFVDHYPEGDKNRDTLKAFIPKMKQASPDAKMETIQEFANDEYTVGWYRWTGTGKGEMGMPNGPYDMQAIELVKYNSDSKAIEHWSFMEMREVMKMMGNMGNMGAGTNPPMPMDTSKMK